MLCCPHPSLQLLSFCCSCTWHGEQRSVGRACGVPNQQLLAQPVPLAPAVSVAHQQLIPSEEPVRCRLVHNSLMEPSAWHLTHTALQLASLCCGLGSVDSRCCARPCHCALLRTGQQRQRRCGKLYCCCCCAALNEHTGAALNEYTGAALLNEYTGAAVVSYCCVDYVRLSSSLTTPIWCRCCSVRAAAFLPTTSVPFVQRGWQRPLHRQPCAMTAAALLRRCWCQHQHLHMLTVLPLRAWAALQ